METRSDKIRRVFNSLDKESMNLVDEFYASNIVFVDPLGEIRGRDALRKYYENLYQNVKEIRFDFGEDIVSGNNHASPWTMKMKATKLNKGREVVLEGLSVIRFNDKDKVIYHRDYFDLWQLLCVRRGMVDESASVRMLPAKCRVRDVEFSGTDDFFD